MGARAALYAPSLLAPALLVAWAIGPGVQEPVRTLPTLAAVALLWLPVEHHLLPALRVPGPGGIDVVKFLGLVDALWLLLVARPVPGVGYTVALRGRDVAVAAAPFAAYAAVVFGLAHLPDPRYVLLATLAGVAYGWVYRRTGRVTASAVTHALVDAVGVLLLRA